ncbi:glucuronate isomerase [Vibrio algicola]|uniref:Uronate isomerase n=1 Tax=Vibrio algicola TaxID=2662262 RepID=A0A5Q0TIR9_9VIBR|nr:glucuronate isomerase [Vibrio algicola]
MTKAYIHNDFLLQNETAKHLYHTYAKNLPIIDYHNHLDAKEIYGNSQLKTISQAWLSSDHYLWRAMRSTGIDEHFITGSASEFEKFQRWCECVPYLIGNPLYAWSHLELKRYFEIDTLIQPKNTNLLWQQCNDQLAHPNFRIRQVIERSNVDILCTTDSPLSALKYHQMLAQSDFSSRVLPTFRSDDVSQIENNHKFKEIVNQLSFVCHQAINNFSDYLAALSQRVEFFHQQGCRLSDLGLKKVHFTPSTPQELDVAFARVLSLSSLTQKQTKQLESAIFVHLGKAYHQHGWTMQLHIGVHTNVNTRRFKQVGAGTGFSVMNDDSIVENVCLLLDQLDQKNALPQTILYSLNPKDFEPLASILGAFQDNAHDSNATNHSPSTPPNDSRMSKIQLGPAWWFNDHKDGMEKQLKTLANLGALGRFIGMLTDSRNVFSLSRHEYFRRVLCNLIGDWVEKGEVPNDETLLKNTIENICYYNAKAYFRF